MEHIAATKEREMKGVNCPNCGAPITGQSCGYCGTRLEDILRLASGKPVTIAFEIGGKELTVRFLLESLTMRYEPEITNLYSDICGTMPCRTLVVDRGAKLELEGRCLPFEDGMIAMEKLS